MFFYVFFCLNRSKKIYKKNENVTEEKIVYFHPTHSFLLRNRTQTSLAE